MAKANFDEKLLKNVLDEINRLNNILVDLETYKDEFSPEEIEETKSKTLKELFDTQKILEKMKSGDLTTTTAVEEANKKLYEVIAKNYHTKDLISNYLSCETEALRERLNACIRLHAIKRISDQEFNSTVIQLLQIIAKNSTLNQEEQKLYDDLKKKNLSSLQEDKGIDKSKLEQNLNKQK